MKIGQTPELPGALAQTGSARPAKHALGAARAGTGDALAAQPVSAAGMPVTVSGAARALTGTDATHSTGDFDADKVRSVRTALDRGTFHVDAGAIADKMLANAQEILSRSRA